MVPLRQLVSLHLFYINHPLTLPLGKGYSLPICIPPVHSILALAITLPKQSFSVSKARIQRPSIAVPFLHATMPSYSTRVYTLAEDVPFTSTWIVTCSGAGIMFSKLTQTVCAFPALTSTATSWPPTSTLGNVLPHLLNLLYPIFPVLVVASSSTTRPKVGYMCFTPPCR